MSMPHNKTEFNRGLDLFNRSHFFDAHEVLEDVWRELQLAVVFNHESKGNHLGARSVLERPMRNIGGADSSFPDLDLDRLRAELEIWRRYLDHPESAGDRKLGGRDVRRHDILDSSAPALPKIMKRR